MNHHDDPDDDQEFDAYLKRGSALSKQYRESSMDEVPPELDQKVLLQAHNAVTGKKVVTHPMWWRKWSKPLALAATLMLAFTVIYRTGHQSIEKLALSEAPVSLQARTTPSSLAPENKITTMVGRAVTDSAQPESAVPKEAKREESVRALKSDHVKQVASLMKPIVPASAPVLSSATVAEAPSVAAKTSIEQQANAAAQATPAESNADSRTAVVDSISAADVGDLPDRNVSGAMQRIPGITLSNQSRASATDNKPGVKPDPEIVLQNIRNLRKQGKNQAADKAWRQFRKDWPDYPVKKDDPARGVMK